MNSILQKIAAHKKLEVTTAKSVYSIDALNDQSPLPLRDFISALKQNKPAVIAEIKKASPSKGIIRADFNVEDIAAIYEQHGAACLSVLTDKHFFQGDNHYLAMAKEVTQLPVLRKDFIIDDYQIHESRALGADCILLIAALLDDHELLDFCQIAQALGMAVLVESHDEVELARAMRLPTPLMGVNNRSLHSFVTSIETSLRLSHHLEDDKLLISESGINTIDDIRMLQSVGINHFLIGESLMREKDIGSKLSELIMGGKM